MIFKVHTYSLSKLLRAVDHVQWLNIELHCNRYPISNGCNMHVFLTDDLRPLNAGLYQPCVVDTVLDDTAELSSRGERFSSDCSMYSMCRYVWTGLNYASLFQQYERERYKH